MGGTGYTGNTGDKDNMGDLIFEGLDSYLSGNSKFLGALHNVKTFKKVMNFRMDSNVI